MGACKSSPKDSKEDEQYVEVVSVADPKKGDPAPALDHEHSARESELEWMNYMITVMWPFVRQAMIKKVGEKFHEKFHEELAKHPEVTLDELSLEFDPGSKAPTITGLRVYQRTQQERTGLQVDVDGFWKSAPDFNMKMTIKGHAKMFPIVAPGVGVSAVDVGGTASCLMAPLLDVIPCVGTGQIFFLDLPQINLKVSGMKKLGPIGNLLTNVMEGVVKNVLADSFILPHRFVQKVRKDLPLETMVTMKSPLPLALLVVDVLEARNLPASDTSITGKKSSDPFVEVKVGYGRCRSSTIANTLNPKWTNEPPGHLFVYNVAQLVRITVCDDDVMGADVLGTVVGYNVFMLMQEQKGKPDGVWHQLLDADDKPAGQIKLRMRYFDVGDLGKLQPPTGKPATDAPPHLLTVKLLGLEAEDRGDLRNCRATVEVVHPVPEGTPAKVNDEEHHANRMMMGLDHAMTWAKTKVKAVTGLEVGFGSRQDGVPSKGRSGKAVLWGSQKQMVDSDHHVIPPMAIKAMEKLHIEEGWPISKVATMFQLTPEDCKTAIQLRGNFEVAWHEAIHFLQPAADPYSGKVMVSVNAPTSNQVRGADDDGFLGEFEVDLSKSTTDDSTEFTELGQSSRRIRQMLYRPKIKSEKKETVDVFAKVEKPKYVEKPGYECTGIIIELMVEVRQLQETQCELDSGQTLRSKESLIAATKSGGVKMIPE